LKVSDLSLALLSRLLRRGQLLLKLPPFVTRITTDVPSLFGDIALMYGEFDVCPEAAFADFHVQVKLDLGLRRWVKPIARFSFDGQPSFTGLPAAQAFAMLEWGLNWCVAAHSHQYLVIHAAVIEKNGKAAVLPAPPGSGKSTLCAGLVMKGWRLLSDELALYDMQTGLIYGMARPISLKNKSIDVIQALAPSAVMTKRVPNTTKGTIALCRPPLESIARVQEPVRATWVILPKYIADAPPLLVQHSRAKTSMLIAEQSFNYDTLGPAGFKAVTDLISSTQCYQFSYSNLDDAERVFHDLAAQAQ
jgi:HprK-related kinase A